MLIRRHPEPVHHGRWLVSFAPLMTLLFMLFVVLYARERAGHGNAQSGRRSLQARGEAKVPDARTVQLPAQRPKAARAAALPAQPPAEQIAEPDDATRRFVERASADYAQIAGRPLQVDQDGDTILITAPLSELFERGLPWPMQRGVQDWLARTAQASLPFTSDIRIVVEMPDVTIGSDRGRPRTSVDLCLERLQAIRRVVLQRPGVRDHIVACEWRVQRERPGSETADWEQRARASIRFSNVRSETR